MQNNNTQTNLENTDLNQNKSDMSDIEAINKPADDIYKMPRQQLARVDIFLPAVDSTSHRLYCRLLKKLSSSKYPTHRDLRAIEFLNFKLFVNKEYKPRRILSEESVDLLLAEIGIPTNPTQAIPYIRRYYEIVEEALSLRSFKALKEKSILNRIRDLKYKIGPHYIDRDLYKASVQSLLIIEQLVNQAGFAQLPEIEMPNWQNMLLPIEPNSESAFNKNRKKINKTSHILKTDLPIIENIDINPFDSLKTDDDMHVFELASIELPFLVEAVKPPVPGTTPFDKSSPWLSNHQEKTLGMLGYEAKSDKLITAIHAKDSFAEKDIKIDEQKPEENDPRPHVISEPIMSRPTGERSILEAIQKIKNATILDIDEDTLEEESPISNNEYINITKTSKKETSPFPSSYSSPPLYKPVKTNKENSSEVDIEKHDEDSWESQLQEDTPPIIKYIYTEPEDKKIFDDIKNNNDEIKIIDANEDLINRNNEQSEKETAPKDNSLQIDPKTITETTKTTEYTQNISTLLENTSQNDITIKEKINLNQDPQYSTNNLLDSQLQISQPQIPPPPPLYKEIEHHSIIPTKEILQSLHNSPKENESQTQATNISNEEANTNAEISLNKQEPPKEENAKINDENSDELVPIWRHKPSYIALIVTNIVITLVSILYSIYLSSNYPVKTEPTYYQTYDISSIPESIPATDATLLNGWLILTVDTSWKNITLPNRQTIMEKLIKDIASKGIKKIIIMNNYGKQIGIATEESMLLDNSFQ